jgi:hypothetical protein
MNAVTPDVPTVFRQDDGTPVPFSDARFEWAHLGYDVLVDVARESDGRITYPDIADTLQAGTGIRTEVPPTTWLDSPLNLVAEMCLRNGEPALTALVVTVDTLEVADAYGTAYAIAGQPLPRNLQRAAAEMRAACYDHFSRREAVGWDKTKLTGRVGVTRPAPVRAPVKTRLRVDAVPPKVCASCHLELLPNGSCGYCD